jgi:tetratricopeptide (TPR) repeat protein
MGQSNDRWEEWYKRLGAAKPQSKEWYEIASMMENHHIRAAIVNRGPYDEDEILREAEKALRSAQSALGEKHPRAAEALQNLGFYYTAIKNERDTALDYFEKAKALAGERNPFLADTYFRLGIYCYQQQDAAKAQEVLQEALAVRRADPNADASDVAETLFILSMATAANTGKRAAKALAQEAFDRIKLSAPKSELYAQIKKWLDELKE